LQVPPITTSLYQEAPACNWGTSSDFLSTFTNLDETTSLTLAPHGNTFDTTEVHVSGWAFDQKVSTPFTSVLAISRGNVVASIPVSVSRPDVANVLKVPMAEQSGFTGEFNVAAGQAFALYGETAEGELLPLPRYQASGMTAVAQAASAESASGLRVGEDISTGGEMPSTVEAGVSLGNIDSENQTKGALAEQFTVPAGVDLSDFKTMEISSRTDFGTGTFQLAPQLNPAAANTIDFGSSPRVGNHMFVPVGSCLQWHGYDIDQNVSIAALGPGSRFPVASHGLLTLTLVAHSGSSSISIRLFR
jgi:hypothetical protein